MGRRRFRGHCIGYVHVPRETCYDREFVTMIHLYVAAWSEKRALPECAAGLFIAPGAQRRVDCSPAIRGMSAAAIGTPAGWGRRAGAFSPPLPLDVVACFADMRSHVRRVRCPFVKAKLSISLYYVFDCSFTIRWITSHSHSSFLQQPTLLHAFFIQYRRITFYGDKLVRFL